MLKLLAIAAVVLTATHAGAADPECVPARDAAEIMAARGFRPHGIVQLPAVAVPLLLYQVGSEIYGAPVIGGCVAPSGWFIGPARPAAPRLPPTEGTPS